LVKENFRKDRRGRKRTMRRGKREEDIVEQSKVGVHYSLVSWFSG
jgi:hypothetical protein